MSATFDRILFGLTRTLLRVAEYVDDPQYLQSLLSELGFDVPNGFVLIEIGDAIGATLRLFESFKNTPDLEQLSAEQILNATQAVSEIILAVSRLEDVVNAQLPADFVATSEIAVRLPRRMLDWLILSELEETQPVIYEAMRLLGLIEIHNHAADTNSFQTDFSERIVHWDSIPALFVDPFGSFRDQYSWGQPNFDVTRFLEIAQDLLRTLNVPAYVDRIVGNTGSLTPMLRIPLLFIHQDEQLLAITITSAPPLDTDGVLGLQGALEWSTNVSSDIEIEPGLKVTIQISSLAMGRLEVSIHPQSPPKIVGNSAAGRFAIEVSKSSLNGSLPLLSVDRVLRLDCQDIRWSIGVEVNSSRRAVIFSELMIKGGRFQVSASDGDSFLQTLIPDEGGTLLFDVTLGVASDRGLYMSGSGGLETVIPIHETISGITIEKLYLGILGSDDEFIIQAVISGTAKLGPISASMDRLGLKFGVNFRSGNLGPINLSIGFRPPDGLSLAIDAGSVSGGGYLRFDEPNGRYDGVLQLEIFDIGVTAIGLLTTKDSRGQPLPPPGYSFLIIISVELPPIQLGLGFTLTGIGGLIGIHRTINTEALRSGIRQGSVDSIMFPEDPAGNLPQIISDIRTIFPPRMGSYAFGLMLELGWGTPSLIEAEFGLILEFNAGSLARIILLGQLNMTLPTKDAPIVSLRLDALGIIDFEKKEISLDASLYDSRVAAFSIYGDMAFRLGWGDQPIFLLSIGGYNPHFQPPARFPAGLRRATISLGLGDNPRISLQAYLAISSNSLQFGARAELYAAAGDFNVYGWLSFDALLIFSPFYFRFDFSVGFALRKGTRNIMGIMLEGTLSGPKPFHIRAKACVSILFFDLCISVNLTIGKREEVKLPTADPWALLKPAIEDGSNWQASLPPSVQIGVSLGQEASSEALALVHPMGTVTLYQNIVPLNRQLEKFGEFSIEGKIRRYQIEKVLIGNDIVHPDKVGFVKDFFAPGQFHLLTDSEKLTRPSFEKMVAGISLDSSRVEHADPQKALKVTTVAYETSIIENSLSDSHKVETSQPLSQYVLTMLSFRGAKALSPYTQTGSRKFAANVVPLEPAYKIVNEAPVSASTSESQDTVEILSEDRLLNQSTGEAKLAFLAWLRRGISTEIKRKVFDESAPQTHAEFDIKPYFEDIAEHATVTLSLYGPGEVTGIDPREIIRTYPVPDTFNVENNYFPLVEFDQPDFPWRYTPGCATDNERLLPWIVLIVLADDEIEGWQSTGPSGTLPSVTVNRRFLPDLQQSWAWAHTQIAGKPDFANNGTDSGGITKIVDKQPHRILSRLIAPRYLKDKTAYTACLVPSFKRGQKAGLKKTIDDNPEESSIDALKFAWDEDTSDPITLPVYHHWRFQTGTAGDFEALAKQLLPPISLPSTVGIRKLDVSQPGSGLPSASSKPLYLQGALMSLDALKAVEKEQWNEKEKTRFISKLQEVVNTEPEIPENGTEIVTRLTLSGPLYGRWHAARETMEMPDKQKDPPWFDQLNGDPRWRTIAALGTKVVQDQQQQLMAAAWEQVEGINESNRYLRQVQLACAASERIYERHVKTQDTATLLQLTAPMHSQISLSRPSAVRFALIGEAKFDQALETIPHGNGMVAGQLRKITRPNGPIWRKQRALSLNGTGSTGVSRQTGDLFNMNKWLNQLKEDQIHDEGKTRLLRYNIVASVKLKPLINQAANQRVRKRDDTQFKINEACDQIMEAPKFKQPMYESLRDLSQEWLLPGVSEIPANAVSLLQTNKRFIESYMVGLNHEMARELLWHEYPTDQRGTYFRQFWDVRGPRNLPASRVARLGNFFRSIGRRFGSLFSGGRHVPQQRQVPVPDITPIHEWKNKLGENSKHNENEKIVLLIRGELLRRYPNAIIYAKKAKTAQSFDEEERYPIFHGTLPPDISFIGFDLNRDEVVAKPGWFFIIQEPPTETRFGLDADEPGDGKWHWHDIAWPQLGDTNNLIYIDLTQHRPDTTLLHQDSASMAVWNVTPANQDQSTSSDFAYIFFQKPYQVAIHGSKMLPPEGSE